MFAEPRFTPFTTGWVAGVFCPAAMLTVTGVTVTFVVSELAKVTVTPPVGAASGNVTANGVLPPSGAVTPAGNVIEPAVTTVTFAVASGMFGVELA